MCPLPPSANPSLAKMRNAPAICSSCQRCVASLVSGKGIRCSLLVLPWDVLSMSRALTSAATVGADARTVVVVVAVVMMLDGPWKAIANLTRCLRITRGCQKYHRIALFQGRHAKIVILLRVGNPLPHPLPPNAAPPANCSVLFGNLRDGGPTLSPTPTAKVPACTLPRSGPVTEGAGLDDIWCKPD